MRINDQNGRGDGLTLTNGTSSLGRTDRNDTSTSTASSGSRSDSLQLSGFAGQLSKTLQAGSSIRAQRVSDLTQAVRSGTYQVDGAAVSRAMIDQAIAPGKGAGIS